MSKKFFLYLCLSLVSILPIFASADWSAPTDTPPNANASAPLNVSGTAQTKTGGLLLNTGGAANGLLVQYGSVGIDTLVPSYTLDVNGTIGGTDVYNTGWYRNQSAGAGLYNTSTGKHFYSESANYWTMNSAAGMVLRSGLAGTPTGYLYWDGTAGSNNFGLLSPDGSWSVKTTNSGVTLYDDVNAPYVRDSNDTNFYVDPHSVSMLNDVRANIIYDKADTTYYVDPASTSKINYGRFVGGAQSDSTFYVTGGALWVQGGVTTYLDGYTWVRGPAYGGTGNLQVDEDISIGAHVAVGGGGEFHLYGDGYYWGSWNNMSDRRLKDNIKAIEDPVAKIQKLNGVTFDWKDSHLSSVGVIAQDVEKVFPDLVTTDPKTGMKAVQYQNLVAPLIEAVKAQQAEIDELKARVDALTRKQ